MKKILFQCVANVILFTLLGLTFLYPFADFKQSANTGFEVTFTVFPVLLIVYLILYPIVYFVFQKLNRLDKKDNSELAFSDEREKIIVFEAAKVAYQVLIGGLLVSIATIGGIKVFSLFTQEDISIYFVSILLLTILLIVSMSSYCIKWCIEYQK